MITVEQKILLNVSILGTFMSKLLELMEVSRIGATASSLKALSDLCNINEDYSNTLYGQQYRIKATFGANLVVLEESKEYLDYAVKQVKSSVNEAVFGEFRAPLREIQRLMWERKYHEASKKLTMLEMSMYHI